ncbi:MAG: L-histidine N(alpha)-methyltransferase [Planctomycetes bacterium]|nr:L-histidine N(alpha)-methyltransferase [Planctomycetota bacterium]
MHTRPESAPSALGPEVRRRLESIWRQAYGARTKDDLRALYARWAESYDDDHEAIGFLGHERAADVLARHLEPSDAVRVLDAGAGTGAAGEALAARGFEHVVGLDLSPEMLERAATKGVHEDLLVADLSRPVDALARDAFDAAVLVGVFSYGQAPAHALDEVLRVVRPGGYVVFTLRDDFHAEDAMGVASHLEALVAARAWEHVETTRPEAYLPRKDPDATYRVWCFRVLTGKRAEPEPAFLDAAREALLSGGRVRALSHEHIWDAVATRLYNDYITRPEYYLNDAEEEILRDNAGDFLGRHTLCVELGCGSADKISHVFRAALDRDGETVTYMPIDVSPSALESTRAAIESRFDGQVEVEPALGTFDEKLSAIPPERPKAIFFLGGSIGNFETVEQTRDFLAMIRERMTPLDKLMVGFDLAKDADVLERAYNAGEENRAFFVHMVRRMNELLDADFDLDLFDTASDVVHDEPACGITPLVVNLKVATREAQSVSIPRLGLRVDLAAGDSVQVGKSRKFSPDDVAALVALCGLRLRSLWFDARHYYSVAEIVRDDAPIDMASELAEAQTDREGGRDGA